MNKETQVQEIHVAMMQRIVMDADLASSAQAMKDALLETESNIGAYVRVKNMIAVLEGAMKLLKDEAFMECSGSTANPEDVYGARVWIKGGASRWEYPESVTSQKYQLELDIAAKDLDMLHEKMKLGEHVDMQTGEIIPAAKKVEGLATLNVSFKECK